MASVDSERLQFCTLGLAATLREAMASLETSSVGIVFIVDEGGRLQGTLTDGDIRRALLAGIALESRARSHMQTRFVAVAPLADRAGVLDLMRARGVQQIPIVDAVGHLAGLHLLREMIGGGERPNWAVVMAGGEGKRLRPLTESVPKPMLRVAGRPILERIVLQLVGFGIRRIFLAVNYMGHVIEQHFGDGDQFGCQIEYLREERPLGTAGALSLLPHRPTNAILLMNGDLVTQANLGSMLDFHQQGGQAATIGIRRYLHTVPFGCVETDGQSVTDIEEKPCISKNINSGMYVLNPEVLSLLERAEACGVPDLLELALDRGHQVCAFEIDEDWIDIGRMEQLELAVHGS
ncbi:MAG TPA: nucleotidyltransferase family protein [Terriglobales bacterium]|jgi:dTDP-glucose pyrophosphorylase